MRERARYMAKPVPEERQSHLMLRDPVRSRLISTYQTLPERERRGFVTVLDATATSLSRQPLPMPDTAAERAARHGN